MSIKGIHKIINIFLVCLIFVAMISCRPEPVAPVDASILILDPPSGAAIPSGDVSVRTFVDYFDLVNQEGQANEAGQGHIIFYLDVTPPVIKGESALTESGTCIATVDTFYVWKDIPAGNHVFWVQLVNNDNTPLEPVAAVWVQVFTK